ncbi:MAG TPA: hypothetical protein PLT76_08265 [Candidatus Omnitrophota bacterium]|nr:hypothetical protein [Candidatus Omnitrophota bacterium]HPB67394.1 hypothetical protein [Candidatus Omnitrophota bacterium]HQO58694.1 hypothetical protein [Candidatus Omnitrophota bacterium]HQP11752.1 hypothetical protein [Candidatus Omnitrophota bacterium]
MNHKWIMVFFAVFLAGCTTARDPYAGVRALSNTDPAKNKFVLDHIRFLEEADGRRDCALEVLRVEDRGMELMAYVEYWVVQSCGVKTVYKVRKAPVGPGQYKYTVTYPSAADLMTVK